MDFGDILNQWDALCDQEEKKQKEEQQGSNKPRPRLPNAPRSKAGKKNQTLEGAENNISEKSNVQKSAPQVNPMELWLQQYGVVDKDAMAKDAEERDRSQNREYLKKMPICAKIDLHGLTRDEAWERLEVFVGDCCRRGFKKILIVHGKGHHAKERSDVSILSAMVRTFIELDSRLGASGHPDKKLGGSGATWVIIKKQNKNL